MAKNPPADKPEAVLSWTSALYAGSGTARAGEAAVSMPIAQTTRSVGFNRRVTGAEMSGTRCIVCLPSIVVGKRPARSIHEMPPVAHHIPPARRLIPPLSREVAALCSQALGGVFAQ